MHDGEVPGKSEDESTTLLLRSLPSVDSVLENEDVRRWAVAVRVDRNLMRRAVNIWLERTRKALRAGSIDELELKDLLRDPARAVAAETRVLLEPHLRRVINGTGVVVHTNLGRSPWSAAATSRVAELAGKYINLELDLEEGSRGNRDRPLESLLDRILPGVSAAVVNNNAAAVLLVLNTLADGREVVVSRGQLVEIGGSFRIPDVMQKAGCRLREVGTTNRTRIEDFRRAIGPETGLLLAVHPSNYRLVGFTESVPLDELVALGKQAGIPVVEDLGSGSLVSISSLACEEPTVADRLAAGVDLVTFSGDKLLGGPQAGIIAGKAEAVSRTRANPLYRALRLDKTIYLALEATLLDYLGGFVDAIPTVRMINATPAQLRPQAEALLASLSDRFGDRVELDLIELVSLVGGGAAPEVKLPSWGVALSSNDGPPEELARRLRTCCPAVVARIVGERLVLDVRTLLPGDADDLTDALDQALTA